VRPGGAGFQPFFPSGYNAITLTGFFGALSAALWAYDGWEDLNLVGSEVEDPQRNIPRALILGVTFCIVLYISFSLAAHWALSYRAVAQSPHLGSDLVARIFGRKAALGVTLAMVVSALGTLNSSVLSGARVPYAMARDGIFFRGTAEIDSRFRTPGGAILFEFVISSIFALTGTFEELTSLFLFATWIFYALAVAAMIRMRRTEPGLERPYRCWGYPWVPAAFLAGAAALTVTLWLARPIRSSIGLVLILSGLIFYQHWRKKLPLHS
jgi:APA family basic amino acid/polyamine antiporter